MVLTGGTDRIIRLWNLSDPAQCCSVVRPRHSKKLHVDYKYIGCCTEFSFTQISEHKCMPIYFPHSLLCLPQVKDCWRCGGTEGAAVLGRYIRQDIQFPWAPSVWVRTCPLPRGTHHWLVCCAVQESAIYCQCFSWWNVEVMEIVDHVSSTLFNVMYTAAACFVTV